MKKLFKKTMTVLGSVALVGATVSIGSAASYPAPFDDGAVVVTGSGAAASDSIAAGKVNSGLTAHAAKKSTGKKTVSGEGDKFLLEKSSTKFNPGDTITQVFSSALDDQELEELLAEGTFEDTNNDEFDFTQEIKLAPLQLAMFSNSDYNDEEPTLGLNASSGTNIMNYTLDFTDQPTITNMVESDLRLMGKDYYVLSTSNSGANIILTLLDSADELSLAEGDTKTITSGSETYEISIDYIGSAKASFRVAVDGGTAEVTKAIAEGATIKLDNGAYLAIQELRYNSKDTGISSVVISIGKGKLVLTSGSDLEINDDSVNDLKVTINNATTKLNTIVIQWDADDDLFVTDDSTATMPGFEAVKLSMETIDYKHEEKITVEAGADDYISLKSWPFKDGEADVDFLFTNGTHYTVIGKSSSKQLRTSASGNLTFDDDTDAYFVATYDDGNDAESYLMRATGFKIEDSTNKTDIQYYKDGSWVDAQAEAKAGDTFSLGDAELAVGVVNKVGESVAIWNNSANTNFYTIFTKEGLKAYLPHTTAGTAGYLDVTNYTTSWPLQFHEEDRQETKAAGDAFNVTIGHNSQSPKEPSVTDIVGEDVGFVEKGDTDVFRSFMYSELATELLWDQGPDQRSLELIYHGEEVEAKVYVTAPSVGVSAGGDTGIKTVDDTETAAYAGKNIVVIGGSAINTVAADLLGGAHRGEAFTTATSVSAGGFLIQSFAHSGKTALLVAGYNAADTSKAVDYLVNNEAKVDTAHGNKYVGTSATEAKLMVS